MKLSLVLALLPSALALPTLSSLLPRQSLNQITDSYLFSITLPAFTSNRNALRPSNLDWTSDGCTSSPDNPFGFNFIPACHRHDFGYHNYRLQSRFTQSGKLRIDDNFLKDLRYQCSFESFGSVCRGLANVYYQAVRAFGGGDATPGKREVSGDVVDEEAFKEYEEAVAKYEELVKAEQEAGRLPVPE